MSDWRELPAPASLRLDIFPAAVEGFAFPPPFDVAAPRFLRVTVTDERWFIFAPTDDGPNAVAFGDLFDMEPGGGPRAFIIYPAEKDRDPFTVTRPPGCGCGSGFRSFRPFPGVPLRGAPRRPTF